MPSPTDPSNKTNPIIRERSHRLPREHYLGHVVVSFTACIEYRNKAFINPDIVYAFVEILRSVAEKYSCIVLVYCFMPDHLHIVVQGINPQADTLRLMNEFKQKTGFWFARQGGKYRWQKDFHDHILRSDENVRDHVIYIANNPVRQKLVQCVSEYPFTGSIGVDLETIVGDSV